MAMLDNAIFWAHFQTTGGWRRIAWTAGIVAACLGLLTYIIVHLPFNSFAIISPGWVAVYMVAMPAILLLIGTGRISNTITRDFASGMIESNRVMPIPGVEAVVGYLLGPTALALPVYLAAFVVGTLVSQLGSTPIDQWLLDNVLILLSTLVTWAGITWTSFALRRSGMPVMIVLTFASIASIALVQILPGMEVFMAPLAKMYNLRMPVYGSPMVPEVLSIFSQLLMIGIFIAAAARRYERPTTVSLISIRPALVLGLWVFLSCWGIEQRADRSTVFMNIQELYTAADATLVVTLLLAIFPAIGIGRRRAVWWRIEQIRRQDPMAAVHAIPPLRFAIWPALMAIVYGALAAFPVLPLINVIVSRHEWYLTLTSCTVSLVSLAIVADTATRYLPRSGSKIALFWIIAWVVPLTTALLQTVSDDPDLPRKLEQVYAISPLGFVCVLWSQDYLIDVHPGLIGQCAVLVLVVIWSFTVSRARRAKPAYFEDVLPAMASAT